MKFALNIKDDGRILSATTENFAPPDAVLVDNLPDGNLSDYRWQDGAFVYDPLPDPEPEPEPEPEPTVWDELDAAYQEGVNSVE